MNLANLRAKRDVKVEQARALNDKYPSGKPMPREDGEALDAMLDEIAALDAQITALMGAGDSGEQEWRASDDSSLKVLRSSADIRRHYAGRPGFDASASGKDIRLDDFVRGVAGMNTSPAVKAALSTGTDTAGGFSVPTVLMPGILEALVPASSLLSAGAGIVPLDSGAKQFSAAALDTIPTAAWRAEGGAVAASDPTFRAVTAAPKSLAFYFKISRELLADGRNLQDALRTAISQAFAKELDRVGLRGTGTAPEPRGILNTSGIQAVTNGTNGAALAGYANFFSAAQAILQVNGPMPTAAIMSPRSLIKLGGLVDTTGQPLRKPEMLENLRMLSTSAVPDNLTVGTSNDCSEIYMGDFTKVMFMMREQMSIQVAQELFAATGEIGFFCHMRVDVAVLYPKVLSLVTGVRP
jgi:HK97 family phage major capsid protein